MPFYIIQSSGKLRDDELKHGAILQRGPFISFAAAVEGTKRLIVDMVAAKMEEFQSVTLDRVLDDIAANGLALLEGKNITLGFEIKER